MNRAYTMQTNHNIYLRLRLCANLTSHTQWIMFDLTISRDSDQSLPSEHIRNLRLDTKVMVLVLVLMNGCLWSWKWSRCLKCPTCTLPMMQMALFMLTLIVSHLLCVTVNWDGTLMCFWSNTSNIFGAWSFQVAALACDQLREDGPLKTVFRSSSFVEVVKNVLFPVRLIETVHSVTKSDTNQLKIINCFLFCKVHPVASSLVQ